MTEALRSSKRWLTYSVVAILFLVFGAACTWAVMTAIRPAEDPLASTDHTYAEVAPGEVGASLSLNVIAKWTSEPAGINQAVGVLTSLDAEAGEEISQGSVLYTVNLRPVVVAQGDVPAFRAIAADTKGADVKQLQSMLASLGHYGGGIDGEAGDGTVRAIQRWQGSLGLEKTGVVELGDIVFVRTLPTRIMLNAETMKLGSTLAGGEQSVNALPPAPEFSLAVTEAQARMIPADAPIEMTSPEGETWNAVATDQAVDSESDAINVSVSAAEGATICGEACVTVPVGGEITLPAKITTVPTVTGLVVPSSALVTTAGGKTAVLDVDGTRIPVIVEASAKGMSVVSGVEEGLKVQVPASEKAAP
ncbi:peptidoglycan-binding domain-containing protein [Zhihengliuella sp. ISTPL4]|uniref:peptidoglycan-binding domain-containing protein n=1 Tax=Zhihengliuella sp. ISTPL4 TaxID=2058657 RepID=UPI000C7B7F31|nr:peptidoglycan-binding domain-containing protein [Zhihengliuella sp. ISTPL4]